MPLITLLSDFGLKDNTVAAVKARLHSLVHEVRIVDISHDVSPYNILEAAYLVKHVYREFPENTIHIIGIDAEYTIEKPHIWVQCQGHYFIGADNGFFHYFIIILLKK